MKYALAFTAAAALAATAAFAGEMGDKGMCMDGKAMDAKLETHFKEVDANADGKITEKELVKYATAKAKKQFAEMSGGDGEATFEEAKAFHMANHQAMMKDQCMMMGDDAADAGESEPAPDEHSEHH